MTKRELMFETLAHRNPGKVPQAVHLTGEGYQAYGGSISFYGGISTRKALPYGTPGEVRAETRRIIALMSRDDGYLTSPSQAIQD
ncbi:MAG: hypothetical protein LBE10_10470 [Treponema sp.]|nr:hypothetical protein [Treponema sp.]